MRTSIKQLIRRPEHWPQYHLQFSDGTVSAGHLIVRHCDLGKSQGCIVITPVGLCLW